MRMCLKSYSDIKNAGKRKKYKIISTIFKYKETY